jgi:hypothetical protein
MAPKLEFGNGNYYSRDSDKTQEGYVHHFSKHILKIKAVWTMNIKRKTSSLPSSEGSLRNGFPSSTNQNNQSSSIRV